MNSNLGAVSAFLASLTWAIGGTIYASLAHRYPASVINTSRAGIALICFTAALLVSGHNFESFYAITNNHLLWLTISIISSYALGDVLFFTSAKDIGVPAALTIASAYPLWSATAGYFIRHEALRIVQILGLILIVLGVSIVVLTKNTVLQQKNLNPRRGYLLALCTSFLWAMNSFSVSKGSANLDPLLASAMRMAFAFLLCPLIGAFLGTTSKLLIKMADVKKYLWIFIIEGFGGTFFFVYGFANCSLAVAGALTSLAPVLSVPIALATGSERLNIRKLLGIAVVTAGIILLVR
jgi:drug/metabolite transporter (DMT)-like permease